MFLYYFHRIRVAVEIKAPLLYTLLFCVAIYTSSANQLQPWTESSDCDGWASHLKGPSIYNGLFQGIQNTSVKFLTHPQGGTYNISETVVLYCNLSSRPSCYANKACPYIYWTFNDHNITANDSYHIRTSIDSSTLMINKMTEGYLGVYACQVEDGVYSVWSVSATVAVPGKL